MYLCQALLCCLPVHQPDDSQSCAITAELIRWSRVTPDGVILRFHEWTLVAQGALLEKIPELAQEVSWRDIFFPSLRGSRLPPEAGMSSAEMHSYFLTALTSRDAAKEDNLQSSLGLREALLDTYNVIFSEDGGETSVIVRNQVPHTRISV